MIVSGLVLEAVTGQDFDMMSGDEKKFMKKSIAENMIQSTHINGGFTNGPQFGTLRHKPESLTKQQICVDIPTMAELKSAKNNPEEKKANQIKQHITLKTMRSIMDGTYQEWIEELTKNEYPQPKMDYEVMYNHEQFQYLDLGNDFNLGEKSFTLASLIRLRPDQDLNANYTNRGTRILSKRTDAGVGWELVAPSFYTGAVSLYAGNENREPGHIDYGRSRLPNNAWMCVGVTVDRENFGKDMAHVVPFVNGFSDGPGMSMRLEGSLDNDVPLTVGNHRDESGEPVDGRRDFTLDGAPRFGQHFQGDIGKVMFWDEALSHKEIRMMCRDNLAKMGVKTGNCPKGWEEYDCKCYKVVDHELKTFKEARQYCSGEGGTLVMPKTDQQQDFIEILMQQSHAETFWIGLDDLETEKVHKWADGTLLDYKKGDYNRYLKGQPDKMYQTEDCVENIKSRGGFYWNDENCAKVNSFICEKSDTLPGCVHSNGEVQEEIDHDELLAKLLSGEMEAPHIGLKSAKSNKKNKKKDKKSAKAALKLALKEERKEERKEEIAGLMTEAKMQMKKNLRKNLKNQDFVAELVEPNINLKTNNENSKASNKPKGARHAWLSDFLENSN